MTKPRKKSLYYADDKDALFKANYVDSLYGMRMLLRPDGRRRGLWIWLEEEVKPREITAVPRNRITAARMASNTAGNSRNLDYLAPPRLQAPPSIQLGGFTWI